MAELHFLRPVWLIAAALAPLVVWLLWWQTGRRDPWQSACDPRLLTQLSAAGAGRRTWSWYPLAGLAGVLGAVALAGPTWDAIEAPVYRETRARVVVLDLSRSMDAIDVAPSRMTRARAKAAAILGRSREQQVGLVVFAGAGYGVTPITPDADTLIGILPAFDTSVVPVQGSRPDLGLLEAERLIRTVGAVDSEIVLISDGAASDRAVKTAGKLHAAGIRVSVLAVGTPEGGRIALEGGGFLRGLDGGIVVARTTLDLLQAVADAGGGRFERAGADDADVERLLGDTRSAPGPQGYASVDRKVLAWLDRGPWLAVALLPLAALGFRRGWAVGLACACFAMPAAPLQASSLVDPSEGNVVPTPAVTRAAARDGRFDWRWLGVDLYRQERFVEAADLFAQGDRADDHYNRGNALAMAGLLRAAVSAYLEALAREPAHEDALFNQALVLSLMSRQQQQQQREERRRDASYDAELVNTEATQEDPGDPGNASGAGEGGARPEQRQSQGGESEEDAAASAAAGGDRSRDDAPERDVGPLPAELQARLTSLELERIEEALAEIAEERLGLWRRKIEIEWSAQARRQPRSSDAW